MSTEGSAPSRPVVGVGIDTADVAEVRHSLRRHADRYLRLVLSDAERAECARTADPARETARRWAAKEAVTKVLDPAPDDAWPWPQVEILGLATEAPEVHLTGRARHLARARGVDRFEIREHPGDAARVTTTAIGLGPQPHTVDSTREKDR